MIPIERRNTPIAIQERRKAERFKIALPALVREGPAFPTKVSLCDVSESGLRFEGQSTLDPRRRYPVEILLANGDRVRAEARVVWMRAEPYITTYGAQWTTFSWWERRKLGRALRLDAGAPLGASVDWWTVISLACLGTGLLALAALFYLKQLY